MSKTDWMAHALACAEATEQAEFINGFARSLMVVCKGRAGDQMCRIAEDLEKTAAEVLRDLADYHRRNAEDYDASTFKVWPLRDEIARLEARLRELHEQGV